MINVRNCESLTGRYAVVRNCEGEYWYYGTYDDFARANSVANEIGNGFVCPTSEINSVC